MGFDILKAAPGSHMSLLTEQEKWLLLADGNQFHKFLRNAGFYLMDRNPIVHLTLMSGDMDRLLESEESEFFGQRLLLSNQSDVLITSAGTGTERRLRKCVRPCVLRAGVLSTRWGNRGPVALACSLGTPPGSSEGPWSDIQEPSSPSSGLHLCTPESSPLKTSFWFPGLFEVSLAWQPWLAGFVPWMWGPSWPQ